jgi:hypothetical protein
MSTSDDAWLSSPWPPRNGAFGGTSYPGDWTDPFVNLRTAAPNPFASAAAPFSAAQLGAMAWHPPIFPNSAWQFPLPTPAPANVPQIDTPPGLLGGIAKMLAESAPTNAPPVGGLLDGIARLQPANTDALPSILGEIARFPSAAPASFDNSGGLFSRGPSIPFAGGLFPYQLGSDTDPTSPFGSGFSSAGGRPASVPAPGMPGAASTLGWPAPQSPFPPLAQLQSPFAAGGPALDSSNGLLPSPADGSGTPPGRSVLFNRPQPTLDLDSLLLKRERDAATLDSIAQELGPTELPLSKSGTPFVSPPPQLSIAPPSIEPLQWLDLARFLSPNLVDYFTKTLPPSPPFPSTPGKIPSSDNPYAPGAALEAATFFLPQRRIVAPLEIAARTLEESALKAASRAAKTAVGSQSLARAGVELVARPYGELSGTLPPGWQAHHLNQNAVYSFVIPRREGLSVAFQGNALTDPGTQHFVAHEWLEQQFWDQYRENGILKPTNEEYGEAGRLSLIAGGVPPALASDFAAQAAAQRAAMGLSETAPVPRIPGRINQIR